MHTIFILLTALILPLASTAVDRAPQFQSAVPVWPALPDRNLEREKNLFVGFRAVFDAPETTAPVVLRITGRTVYRIYCNGEFAGYGPARGPHGYDRVDEWPLNDFLNDGKNTVAIEVAGYNVNSFYTIDQPSYLQAEVVSGGTVLAFTGDGIDVQKAFRAILLPERVQKVQRYSFQRPFIEVYRLTPDSHRWRTHTAVGSMAGLPLSLTPKMPLLPRRVSYPRFQLRQPLKAVSEGTLEIDRNVEEPWRDRSLTGIGPKLGGYPIDELEAIISDRVQKIGTIESKVLDEPLSGENYWNTVENSFRIFDFGTNLTGFIGASIQCQKPATLIFTFDEILSDGDVDFLRLSCVNAVTYHLQPGTYHIEAFEPNTLRYLKVMCLDGDATVTKIYLREYVNPDVWKSMFACSDNRFNQLFAAARETFRQNALDIFMDCPSRERAGWLCDSFFTSRTAKDLSGHCKIERNFFENYRLPKQFEFLPEGMISMCYPADHNDGVFIPNWSLWFVVQLEEYLQRSGDRETVEGLHDRIDALFRYFERFRNEDKLLEKLESWVFVEWSKANEFVQDVNYPSNMLYAAALAAAGRMYYNQGYLQDAEAIRDTIRKQSYDGQFFVDNALRRDGQLGVTKNHSEVCQYFAFFFDVATPETFPDLWKTLVNDFGPQREETQKFPNIHVANAFVGNVLRLEILSRYGLTAQLMKEAVDYQMYMVERTGTLWENQGAYASCNHGFASHTAHVLFRDALGILKVDSVNKQVHLRFTDIPLEWCEGRIPTEDGFVSMRWWKADGALHYHCDAPAGYAIEMKNLCTKPLAQHP